MTRAGEAAAPAGPVLRATAEILNKRGLHARASAKFVTIVAKYQSEVTVTRDGATVSGRSIMGLMMLGAAMGSTIDITAQGPDAEAAMAALLALIANKFEEDQ
jgi:phosphocarrier protein